MLPCRVWHINAPPHNIAAFPKAKRNRDWQLPYFVRRGNQIHGLLDCMISGWKLKPLERDPRESFRDQRRKALPWAGLSGEVLSIKVLKFSDLSNHEDFSFYEWVIMFDFWSMSYPYLPGLYIIREWFLTCVNLNKRVANNLTWLTIKIIKSFKRKTLDLIKRYVVNCIK